MPKLRKYLAVFQVSLLTKLTYVYDVLARQILLVIIMFVFVQLWRTTYRWEGASTISGFTMRQMIWYLALSESIVLAMPRSAADVDSEVKSGALAYNLSKPYSYPLFHYATYMGDAAVRFAWNFLVAAAVTWIMVGAPVFTPASFTAGLISVVLGFTLDFWSQMSIGLLAFWVEDTYAFRLLSSRLTMLLGGMMLPLDVFPEWLRRIALKLPVSCMVYGPVKTFLGLPMTDWILLISRQAGWILVMYLLATVAYRTGVKRVNVQGG